MSVLHKILTRQKKTFNHDRLPPPQTFYARFDIHLKSRNWSMHKCPFHDDKHASLSINGTHGGFICHACHVKGSMVGFYMNYHHTDYKTTMQELGAYDEY